MPRPSSRTTRSRALLGLAAAALLGVTACGGDDDDTSDATDAPATTQVAAATDAPEDTAAGAATTLPASEYPVDPSPATSAGAAPAGAGTVAIAESSLGPILVDGAGMTLYMFVPDDRGPSTCTGQCLAAWPAVAGPVTAGEGVDPALLGTAPRPDDGSDQATYNGWPLYSFIQDAAPGDVTGQDANDKWYVLDATGTPVGME